MWQKLVSLLKKDNRPVVIPVTDRNVLLITAFIKKGVVTVSYKGKTRRGKFVDNTLKNMVHGIRFEKSTNSFLGSIAQLIKQITEEK